MLTISQPGVMIKMVDSKSTRKGVNFLTDTVALRNRIKESGLKLSYVAKVLGITAYTLQRKLDNDVEFKVSEVEALSTLLHLTLAEKDAYFFAV
nr:MAG TPA: Protein of unknown function (DUF739) [Caudoviricetes sp.]